MPTALRHALELRARLGASHAQPDSAEVASGGARAGAAQTASWDALAGDHTLRGSCVVESVAGVIVTVTLEPGLVESSTHGAVGADTTRAR